MNNPSIGTLASLWRFPVKSLLGERLQTADVTEQGIVGDRAYGLVERESGKVVSAKNVKDYPMLLHCRAAFTTPPKAGADTPPVRITLPDGTALDSDAPRANEMLSRCFGRAVELRRAAPADFTIDANDPDLATGELRPLTTATLGSALWAELGARSPIPVGAFFDAFPLSMLTRATLNRLHELRPRSNFDERRFRMNLIVDTDQDGFVENEWISRTLAIGSTLRARVVMPDPRCVVTTIEQDDLPRDVDVLRALSEHNRLPFRDNSKRPCAGVYAVLVASGSLAVGDAIRFV